jgi:CRISPR-associated protein Cas1
VSYLYVEHCRIDQEDKAIALHDKNGKTPVPCASLVMLMLGPGTSITHAAIRALADNGCLVIWSGEENVRFYAQGMGETRSARNLLRQARLCSNPDRRLQVVLRMYQHRFDEPLGGGMTLRQIRGREGIRVRESYARASRATGVPWHGRSYVSTNWAAADPVNRALSCANSCLYGICHAAIVSMGYSPALGFIHTGKMLSFVYDIADLYKADLTIPLA